jgi:alpha-D-xyloside xylohydrolase
MPASLMHVSAIAVASTLYLLVGCARPAPPPVARAATEPLALPDAPPVPGPVLAIAGGFLKIEVCAENVIRVVYAADPRSFQRFLARATLATAAKRCLPTPFQVTEEAAVPSENRVAATVITTATVRVRVERPAGTVAFCDAQAGASSPPILAERAGGRSLSPALVQGESTFNVRQQWQRTPDEALYGLGQHQQDLLDLRDVDLDLHQYNTEIFVPFLVSSRGYGILWDNTSFTRFGDLTDAVPLPVSDNAGLYAATSSPGAQPGDVAIRGTGVDWTGTVVPPVTGDYLLRAYSAGDIKVSVTDGAAAPSTDPPLAAPGEISVIDHWRQRWLPGEDLASVHLTAGRPARVRLRWTMDGTTRILRLLWKPPVPDRSTSLWSKVGDGVDYTFVYGPRHDLDRVIAGYRQLTGQAPMMPRSAFGLWQSRERYRTQQESLDVVKQFRARGIPVDNIVQDWQYWNVKRWGSHAFDPVRFPDPDGWIKALHAQHVQVMVSVWPKFYPGTPTFDALAAGGFLFARNLVEARKDFLGNVFTVYDAFDPDARRLYWSQIDGALRTRGVDMWWMDATEPEMVDGPFASAAAQIDATESHMTPTRLGGGARVLNAYSLVNSQAIYEGSRAANPDRRVLILTRNGFAGQQRYAAASWSGDISSTWTALRKQIPAGLGFSISGLPYWTVDSGGFSVPYRFAKERPAAADVEEWRELATRWFEYATFLPILRSHGQSPNREMWEYGDDTSPAYAAQLKYDRLRYRLLPYIYSLAGAVTHQAGTILRPLVMDFPEDARARQLVDEYMFGPAFLVSPIVTFGARSRAVYLPRARGPGQGPWQGPWYDLWTGAAHAAGQVQQAPAPYDAIPVHVRAGAIVPVGPALQFTDEKPADPITLMVYEGADGAFTLYEDDGVSYQYEKGAFTRIPISWTQATRTLTIGAREGTFPGMLTRRQFVVYAVAADRPMPFPPPPAPATPASGARTVTYDGAVVRLKLE